MMIFILNSILQACTLFCFFNEALLVPYRRWSKTRGPFYNIHLSPCWSATLSTCYFCNWVWLLCVCVCVYIIWFYLIYFIYVFIWVELNVAYLRLYPTHLCMHARGWEVGQTLIRQRTLLGTRPNWFDYALSQQEQTRGAGIVGIEDLWLKIPTGRICKILNIILSVFLSLSLLTRSHLPSQHLLCFASFPF